VRPKEWGVKVCKDEFLGGYAVGEGKPVPQTMVRPVKHTKGIVNKKY
jgi:hypothetical protein